MKLSNKSEYAIRAVNYLAKNNKICRLGEISKSENIPEKFLEQIFYVLKSNGFIESKRGINGGYRLSKKPSLITVGEVLRTIEDSITPYYCVDNPSYKCSKQANCEIKDLWIDLKKAIAGVLDNKTFAELAKANVDFKGCYI